MQEKIAIYEQLIADKPVPEPTAAAGKAGPAAGAGSGGGTGSSGVKVDDIIQEVKQAIIKGTGLWKANKRDECFSLYLKSCEDNAGRLRTEALKKPLQDAVGASRNAVGTQVSTRRCVLNIYPTS